MAQALGLVPGPMVHTHNVGVAGLKPSGQIDLLFSGFDENQQAQTYAATNARAIFDDFDPHADIIIGMNVLRLFRLIVDQGVPQLVMP